MIWIYIIALVVFGQPLFAQFSSQKNSNEVFEIISFSNDNVKFKTVVETKFYTLALLSDNQGFEAKMFSNSEGTVVWANGAQLLAGSSMSMPATFGVGAMTLPKGAVLTVEGFKIPENFKAKKIKFDTGSKIMYYDIHNRTWDDPANVAETKMGNTAAEPTSSEYQQSNDYALLHIYRPGSMKGMAISYNLHLNDEVVFRVKNKSKTTLKITNEGLKTLWAKTETRAELPVDIKLGYEYYIRCGVGFGAFVGRPKLEIVDNKIGKDEFDKIPSNEKNEWDSPINAPAGTHLSSESGKTQVSVSPQNTAINRVSYENKIYTVRLGKVVNNGQGNVTVEILTDEKIDIPVKNGAYVVPIMADIEAGGRTFVTRDNVLISDNSLLFTFGAIPDKITVYGNDGNANVNGLIVTFYAVNNTINTRQPQPVIVQPQSQVTYSTPAQNTNVQQAATNNEALKTRWGIKGGFNVATVTFSNSNNSASFNDVVGAVVGVTLEQPFSPHWFFHSGLELSMKGFDSGSYFTSTIKATAIYIQLPAAAGYKFNIGKGWKLELRAGLYFAYGVAGSTTASGYSGSVNTFGDKILNPFDCGAIFGGFFDNGSIVLGVHGESGFTQTNGDNFTVSGATATNSNVSFTIGYLF